MLVVFRLHSAFAAHLIWGWEGSDSKATLESLGPTDTMNQYIQAGLSGQVAPIPTSQTLMITVKSRVSSDTQVTGKERQSVPQRAFHLEGFIFIPTLVANPLLEISIMVCRPIGILTMGLFRPCDRKSSLTQLVHRVG